jgi:hypothetical protein
MSRPEKRSSRSGFMPRPKRKVQASRLGFFALLVMIGGGIGRCGGKLVERGQTF